MLKNPIQNDLTYRNIVLTFKLKYCLCDEGLQMACHIMTKGDFVTCDAY